MYIQQLIILFKKCTYRKIIINGINYNLNMEKEYVSTVHLLDSDWPPPLCHWTSFFNFCYLLRTFLLRLPD